MKAFSELTEREILALAISAEEEDSRIYSHFAERLSDTPSSAKIFTDMAAEENEHRRLLLDMYLSRFGSNLPPIRREDVKGFLKRKPTWLLDQMSLERMRRQAEDMEIQAARFYDKAMAQTKDVATRKLLGDLAAAEKDHGNLAARLEEKHLTSDALNDEAHASQRMFVLQYVQPGLAGLMDGSVSTLAPLFAAAFSTHNNWSAFIVGLAASVGAGISMGFAEALSDDGSITGRGAPMIRGVVCGLMTTIGGLGHTFAYLIPNSLPNAFLIATAIACLVVLVELFAIAYIRARYMDTPFLHAVFQTVLGGAIVVAVGMLIGIA